MGEITARCADHRTPLLYEQWYVAALSTEVSQALSEVWVLQHSLVLYRKRDGVAVALQNRCPHRSYPLSHGVRDGDSVICGYHGLTFDADGRCVRIPSQEAVATRLRTRSYPLVEQRPFIWVWMGAGPPAGAPPAAPWLNNPDYVDVCGVFNVLCSYIRLHENVLDLTHLPFLHRASFKTSELSKTVPQMSTDGIQVRVRLETQMQATSGASAQGEPAHTVQVISELCFASPAVHIATTTVADLDTPPEGRATRRTGFVHAFTPVDPTSTRYFWCVSRDSELDDLAASERARQDFTAIFSEDVAGLSRVEAMWAREQREDFREISVAADRPGLRMRQNIENLARAEAESREAAAPVRAAGETP